MRFGVSTSFLGGDIESPDDIVKIFEELGFCQFIELNYRTPYQLAKKVRKRLLGKVYSVHNFFPQPPFRGKDSSQSEPLNMASLDEEERKLAVKYTLKTIESAVDFEARLVVLHCGKVPMENPHRKFVDLFEKGDRNALKDEALLWKGAREKYRASLDRLLLSLDAILNTAFKEGVEIGVENRFYLHEIPFGGEFDFIFSEFEGAPIGYVHDIGHGEVMERLSLVDQNKLLEKLSEKLLEFHVHDVRGLEDHLPAGSGDVDFSKFRPFFKEGIPVVYEIKPGFTFKDLISGHMSFVLSLRDEDGF